MHACGTNTVYTVYLLMYWFGWDQSERSCSCPILSSNSDPLVTQTRFLGRTSPTNQLEESAVVRASLWRMYLNICITSLRNTFLRRAWRHGGGNDGDVKDLLRGSPSLCLLINVLSTNVVGPGILTRKVVLRVADHASTNGVEDASVQGKAKYVAVERCLGLV